MTAEPLRLGFVGAGRFASFVAATVADLAAIRIVAVTDVDAGRAQALAARCGGRVIADAARVCADPEVDAVVVATPPDGHASIAVAALQAGRHVFCEKPLAIRTEDAAAVAEAAARTGRALVVDHVLRYNPLLRCLLRLRPLLGAVQRLSYENDASDEELAEDSWFWDERRSGGIFVEHGVHAFDAGTLLLGSRPVAVSAMSAQRPDSDVVDLVVATARHPGGVLATYAHSFTHASRCERQLLRLDTGAAQAIVSGWIPVHAVIDLWTDDAGAEATAALPGRSADLLDVAVARLPSMAAVRASVQRDAAPAPARGRGRTLRLPHRAHIEIDLGGEAAKPEVYAASVAAAMADLVRCARTGTRPVAGVAEGRDAVAVAVAARRSAATGQTVDLLWDRP